MALDIIDKTAFLSLDNLVQGFQGLPKPDSASYSATGNMTQYDAILKRRQPVCTVLFYFGIIRRILASCSNSSR